MKYRHYSSIIGCVLFSIISFCILFESVNNRALAAIHFTNTQIIFDGEPMPVLYGGELQYFRLRGGPGPNVDPHLVKEIWNRALDNMRSAHMNVLSFYIPWDFHEYQEGKFDFDGTADLDHDGKPDYPSRNLRGFIELAVQKGFKTLVVRPGPYINAEWGFLGFGAIPYWFHEKFPQVHMKDPFGRTTKMYDYHAPELMTYTKKFFSALYKNVLKDYIGPHRPIRMIQLDNESNYMWQSIYNHNYNERSLYRYREFLKKKYDFSLYQVNQAHHTDHHSWESVTPPIISGIQLQQDQDWYLFQDESIYTYLIKIRSVWEQLGVREPDILFTLAESYFAFHDGLLANFQYRNAPGLTGMMGTNLYVKTSPQTPNCESCPDDLLHDQPLRTDHDVRATDSANDYYLGKKVEWVIAPELQGGWWKGINVSRESRQQTYLSALGHGVKAFFVYYMSEGWNWGWDWQYNQVLPIYRNFLKERGLPLDVDKKSLSDHFWIDLKQITDEKILMNIDVKGTILAGKDGGIELYFDAPLDKNGFPRGDKYEVLKEIGEKIIQPIGEYLAQAEEVEDPVVLLKDSGTHIPSAVEGLDNTLVGANWSSGLYGLLLNSGLNPKVLHWGLNNQRIFDDPKNKIIVYQDTGLADEELQKHIFEFVIKGGTLINFFGLSSLGQLYLPLTSEQTDLNMNHHQFFPFNNQAHHFLNAIPFVQTKGELGDLGFFDKKSTYSYKILPPPSAQSFTCNYEELFYEKYQVPSLVECTAPFPQKGKVIQIGLTLQDLFGNSGYELVSPSIVKTRADLFRRLLRSDLFESNLDTLRVGTLAFARRVANAPILVVTIKTKNVLDSNREQGFIKVGGKALEAFKNSQGVEVVDLLASPTNSSLHLSLEELKTKGFPYSLTSRGSTMFLLKGI